MVVVTGREPDSRRPDGAMSSSDAEDDFLEPATPTATQAGHALPLLPQEFPEVVPLNIGGAHFTTRLSTLRRYEDTMLAAMFSGRHYIPTDAEGRYFIDRDGTHFGDVLNFLRSGDLPPRERVRAVYKEAQYYAIGPLLEQLENMQPLKGEKVRQAFLGLMPYYKDHLERIVEIARLRAVQRKARFAKLKVCVFKEEMPITPYECPLLNSLRFERSESDGQLFEHHCEVDVSFGPWEAVADVYDLLHCLVTDLSAQGLTVDHQCIGVCDKHLINHYYCKRPIYEFKITWCLSPTLRFRMWMDSTPPKAYFSPPFGDVTIVAKAMHQIGLRKAQCLQPCLRALASPTFHQPSLLEGLSSHRAGMHISAAPFEDSLNRAGKMSRPSLVFEM